MKRILLAAGLMLAAASAPVSAVGQWYGCSNPLSVCMDFNLTQNGTSFELVVTYTNSAGEAASTLNSAGLLGSGPTVSNVSVLDYTGYAGGTKAWTAGASGMGNPNLFIVAANDNGGGLNPGGWVKIGFTSSNQLSDFTGMTARAHVQRLTSTSCSMQWSSAAQNYVASYGTDCDLTGGGGGGDSTVTPEPITLVLLGSGLFGIGGVQLRRRRRNALTEE